MKFRYAIVFALFGALMTLALTQWAHAQGASLWYVASNYLRPVSSSWGMQVPSLGSAGSPCLTVGATGLFGTSTCGGSLSGGSTNALTYWTSSSAVGATSSPTVGFVTATSGTSTLPSLSVQTSLNLFGTFADALSDLCVAITGGSGLCDGTDNTGGGAGLATSTAIADTQVIYGTSPSTVGAEAAFTYDSATDKLTVTNASTTYLSATTLFGALTGTSSLATALAANGSNCSTGQAPLGINASGAVESCFDVWTEAENTSAAYITSSALTPYLTLAAFYSTTTQDIAESGNLYYTDARVNSYIHGSTTIPKTYTANTFTGLQTLGNASTTALSISGSSWLGTVRSGTWNGTAIGDAYLTKSGDWTGTIDGNNFTGGAIDTGELLYGTGAGTLGELTLGASSTILTNDGTSPRWLSGAALCVAITGSADLCDGSDATGAGGGVATIEENNVSVTTSATNIDFGSSFDVTGATVEADVTLDLLEYNGAASTSLLSAAQMWGTSTTATSSFNLFAINTAFSFLGDYITNVATWFDTRIEALSNVVAAASSVWDFGGSASFEIPNGTGNTVDATGECAWDTTDDQLVCGDSGNTARVVAHDEFQILNATFASTSYAFINTANLQVGSFKDGLEITQIRCNVTNGTSYSITLTDGTNATESTTCNTTVSSDTDVATNDTFTADEIMYLDFGTKSGTPDYLHVQVWARITRE